MKGNSILNKAKYSENTIVTNMTSGVTIIRSIMKLPVL